MLNLLNNPWVSGIGGGIISGLIVYFVTTILFSRKQNKEYNQKLTTANNEILYTLRPLIAQKKIPAQDIITSTISSISRKYELDKRDLLDIPLLVDELIREVVENSFLTPDQKIDFCDKINELRLKVVNERTTEKLIETVVYQRDKISLKNASLLLAGFAFLAVSLLTILPMSGGVIYNGRNSLSQFSAITLVGVSLPLFMILFKDIIKLLDKKSFFNQNLKDKLSFFENRNVSTKEKYRNIDR